MTNKIKEVIVVEGKDDTKRIRAAVNADTIETRGSAVDEDTLALIEKVAQSRGIIIFTDPDFSGEKIRKIVTEVVPNAKHAFLKKSQAVPERTHGSLGVEHASPQAIRDALENVYTVDDNPVETITTEDLLHYGLMGGNGAKQRRRRLSEHLNIGYVNAKQLKHRLAMFQISRDDFIKAMKEIEEEN